LTSGLGSAWAGLLARYRRDTRLLTMSASCREGISGQERASPVIPAWTPALCSKCLVDVVMRRWRQARRSTEWPSGSERRTYHALIKLSTIPVSAVCRAFTRRHGNRQETSNLCCLPIIDVDFLHTQVPMSLPAVSCIITTL
jgi:hypothetical protein